MYCNSCASTYDVICLTETWLQAGILDTEVFCDNLSIFRLDRENQRGGGVLIAVRSSLSAEMLEINNSLEVEFIAVKIRCKSNFVFVSCSYLPPNSDSSVFSKHSDLITNVVANMRPSDSCVIVGDFNLPHVTWVEVEDCRHLLPSCSVDFIDRLISLPLHQINAIRNANGRTLDLIFFDTESDYTAIRTTPMSLPEDSHHPTIEVTLRLPASKPSPSFNFRAANVRGLLLALSQIAGPLSLIRLTLN